MIESLWSTSEVISLRWLLQIVVLSLGLTLAFGVSFRGDSLSRRSLGVASVWLLALVPVVLLVWQPRYQIGLHHPPALPDFSGLPQIILFAWLGLTAIAATLFGVRVLIAVRDVMRLPRHADPQVQVLVEQMAERLAMPTPSIAIGDRCCAQSLWRRTLIVPAAFTAWPRTAQRSVVAHEMVHLYRRDDVFMVALQLLSRLYLFCPWLGVLYHRFVVALEEACDERAAELTGSRAIYLEGLAAAALLEGGGDYNRDVDDPGVSAAVHAPTVAALINPHSQSAFMQRLRRLLGKQQFFEVQSGALAAGMGVGLVVLAASTTFEFVDLPERYRGTIYSIPRLMPEPKAPRPSDLEAPTVRVVTRYSGPGPEPTELATPVIIYPGRALLHSMEGEVLVEFSVAVDGTTVRPRVLRSSNPSYFDKAAIRAVEQTVYQSTYKKGISGVTATSSVTGGELLAVRSTRLSKQRASARTSADNPGGRVEKLFLFRLNAGL